jgi:hypothetical protein
MGIAFRMASFNDKPHEPIPPSSAVHRYASHGV